MNPTPFHSYAADQAYELYAGSPNDNSSFANYARHIAKRFFEKHPRSEGAFYHGVVCLQQGKLDEGFSHLIIAANNGHPEALYTIAIMQLDGHYKAPDFFRRLDGTHVSEVSYKLLYEAYDKKHIAATLRLARAFLNGEIPQSAKRHRKRSDIMEAINLLTSSLQMTPKVLSRTDKGLKLTAIETLEQILKRPHVDMEVNKENRRWVREMIAETKDKLEVPLRFHVEISDDLTAFEFRTDDPENKSNRDTVVYGEMPILEDNTGQKPGRLQKMAMHFVWTLTEQMNRAAESITNGGNASQIEYWYNLNRGGMWSYNATTNVASLMTLARRSGASEYMTRHIVQRSRNGESYFARLYVNESYDLYLMQALPRTMENMAKYDALLKKEKKETKALRQIGTQRPIGWEP